MFVLILGLSLSLASAQPSLVSSCSSESCWRIPDYLLPDIEMVSENTSEERALVTLLCHLDCLERGEEDDAFNRCQDNCTDSYQVPLLMPDFPPPASKPLVMRSNDDGLYNITIPNDLTGSDVMRGSAVLGSGGFGPEVFLIQVSQFGNDTFFPVTSQSKEINLTQFACSEVNISYAVVMSGDNISQYSPSQTVCVFVPQEDADAVQNLTVAFREDIDIPQQAFVTLSWDSPSDISRLEGYQVTVERIAPSSSEGMKYEHKDCAMQAPMTYDINRAKNDKEEVGLSLSLSVCKLTNFMILPTNGSRLTSPLYTCTYIITLISLPGNNNVSTEVWIAYNSQDRLPLTHRCNATYIPETISYTLSISWTVVDDLMTEAVTQYIVYLRVFTTGVSNFVLRESEIRIKPEKRQREYVSVFSVPVVTNTLHSSLSVSVTGATPGRKDPFYWRRPLLPSTFDCQFTTVAFPPNQISSDAIALDKIEPTVEVLSSGILSFTVSWDPPTFLNGDLERYEFCVGEDTLTSTEDCELPSDCLYVQRHKPSSVVNLRSCKQLDLASDMLVADIEYHVEMDTELLFMQIRAVNNFTLPGDWSDPVLVLNTTGVALNSTDENRSSAGGMVWVFVLVVVVFILLVAILIVLFVCVYQKFCIHRRIKYEDTMMLERMRMNGDYLPPAYIPVADEWELRWEDVEIHYNEELGTGTFGRVYRGLLHSRELRDLMNGERTSSRRGSFGRRKSKRKSIHKAVGSCVVAIKRLKDNIDGSNKANFLKEIEMMKKVSGSSHDHQKFVVNMLGCVTLQEPMMLVLEYAVYGDLLSYLRDSRDAGGPASSKAAPYLEPKGAYSQLATRNVEGENQEDDTEDKNLTGKDLLSFARQIAAGMEFLSSLSVVHRDLACRNILVCEDSLVKISDFGLSRSLVNQEVYVTTTKGVLPIRWMAPEALFYRTFDTQSDVWSFGILLWEIYTLGGYPYPTRSNRDILELLTTGYRMNKPELCPDEVYDVMLQCWSTLGLERPTFETLYAKFDRLLGNTTRLQSPYVQVLGTSYYDRLEPKQTDQEQPLDLENAPSNVDTRQCNLSATSDPPSQSNMGARGISLPESSSSFLSTHGQAASTYDTRGRPLNLTQQSSLGPLCIANRNTSPSQDYTRSNVPQPSRWDRSGLSMPLHLSRPQSWVGTSSAELGPRYVQTPLYLSSARTSTSNLTEETAFGSSVMNSTPEHRLCALHSRSVGNIPLLTNANLSTNTRTTKL